MGVVVVPSIYNIGAEGFNIYPFGPSNDVDLSPNCLKCFKFINKIAQAIPMVALFSPPRGQYFELVKFMTNQARIWHR
jgi:predicted CoA-binding protein